MKIEEFRFGNLVEYDGTKMPVGRTFLELFFSKKGYLFQPIQLTEEILLKCGFKKQKLPPMYSCFVIKRKNNYFFTLYEYESGYKIGNMVLEIYIKSLHQLQNLYFALTGEELKINL